MHRIPDKECRKCGGDTSLNWVRPEEIWSGGGGSGLGAGKTGGMKRICDRCGFSEMINDLDEKELA